MQVLHCQPLGAVPLSRPSSIMLTHVTSRVDGARRLRRRVLLRAALPGLLAVTGCRRGLGGPTAGPSSRVPRPATPQMILLTTTSVQDSGLLDVLVPDFRQRTGYLVKPIAVGSGQALRLGAMGEGDVVLAHSPAAEERWMAAGHGLDRRLVMYNSFLLVGPPADPAGIRASASASAALQRIATQRALFISRGDNSGTHAREQQLWRAAGIEPAGAWYQVSGSGMGQTLLIAANKGGYTLTDRGTFLALRQHLALVPLVQRTGRELLNLYHVMRVNPARGQSVNAAGGRAFADYLVSAPAQALIRSFGRDKFGEPLFFPAAGRSVADILAEWS